MYSTIQVNSKQFSATILCLDILCLKLATNFFILLIPFLANLTFEQCPVVNKDNLLFTKFTIFDDIKFSVNRERMITIFRWFIFKNVQPDSIFTKSTLQGSAIFRTTLTTNIKNKKYISNF